LSSNRTLSWLICKRVEKENELDGNN